MGPVNKYTSPTFRQGGAGPTGAGLGRAGGPGRKGAAGESRTVAKGQGGRGGDGGPHNDVCVLILARKGGDRAGRAEGGTPEICHKRARLEAS